MYNLIHIVLTILAGESPARDGDIAVRENASPFERLGRLLGDMSFSRQLRLVAEQEALRSIMARLNRIVEVHEDRDLPPLAPDY